MSMEVQEIGLRNTFEHLRKQTGLTQTDLAKAAGVTRETYNRWVRGRTPLGDLMVVKIAGFLCTQVVSYLDKKELFELLINDISEPKILALKRPLLEDLSLIERVEEEISRIANNSKVS